MDRMGESRDISSRPEDRSQGARALGAERSTIVGQAESYLAKGLTSH